MFVKYKTAANLYTILLTKSSQDAKSNPTLASGDVQASRDGGTFANIETEAGSGTFSNYITVSPAGGAQVKIALNVTLATCKCLMIRFKDVVGAEWEEQTILVYTQGSASAFYSNAGSSSVTLTTQLSPALTALADVVVTLMDSTDTVVQDSKKTNASGQVIFSCDDGSYKVRLAKAGYSFTTPQSLTVSGDTAATYSGTAIVAPAPAAGCQTLYGYVYDSSLTAVAGQEVTAEIVDIPNMSISPAIISAQRLTGATDVNGYFTLQVAKGLYIKVSAMSGSKVFLNKKLAVSSDDTKDIRTY
jgi:hypothetical protein